MAISFARLIKRVKRRALLEKMNAAKKAQADAQAQAAAQQQQQAATTQPATTEPAAPQPVTTATPVEENDNLDTYINSMRNRRRRGAQLPDVVRLLGQATTLGV